LVLSKGDSEDDLGVFKVENLKISPSTHEIASSQSKTPIAEIVLGMWSSSAP